MENKVIKYPAIGAIYDHYKGGKYEVLTLSKHTDTDEILVIYKSLHFGTVFARPLNQWFESVNGFNRFVFNRYIKL